MLNKKNKNKKAETFTNMRAISQKFCNQYNTSNIFLILLGGGGGVAMLTQWKEMPTTKLNEKVFRRKLKRI